MTMPTFRDRATVSDSTSLLLAGKGKPPTADAVGGFPIGLHFTLWS